MNFEQMNCTRSKMWILYSILIGFAICSCHSECEDNTHSNEYRTKFSEEDLSKWIKFQDTIRYFKRTQNGITDTVKGLYKFGTNYSSLFGDNGCYVIYHSVAGVDLFFPAMNFPRFVSAEMSNYRIEPYELSLNNFTYTPGDKLDTATVNGILYQNVIRNYDSDRAYFLAGGIGWIYINDGYRKFELIPK